MVTTPAEMAMKAFARVSVTSASAPKACRLLALSGPGAHLLRCPHGSDKQTKRRPIRFARMGVTY